MREHIIPLDEMLPSIEESDLLAQAMLSTDMIAGLAALEDRLRLVFDYYLQSQDIPGSGSAGTRPGASNGESGCNLQCTWDDILDAKVCVHMTIMHAICGLRCLVQVS